MTNLEKVKADLESRLLKHQETINTIRLDLEAIERMLARYSGQEEMALELEPIKVSGNPREFAGMTLKKAILKLINSNPQRVFDAPTIRDTILKGGFKQGKGNIRISITSWLFTMNKSGLVRKIGTGKFRSIQGEKIIEDEQIKGSANTN